MSSEKREGNLKGSNHMKKFKNKTRLFIAILSTTVAW